VNPSALSVIIPAAGASKRLGLAKQLVEFQGKSLIQNAVDAVNSVSPVEIIVVTGACGEQVRDVVRHPEVCWVHNPDWSTGMGGSIAAGAASVNPLSSGLMILLCDQYRVDSADLQKLVQGWNSNQQRIVAAEAEGRLMPPVIFPVDYLEDLLQLQGDQGARKILESHPEMVTPVAMKNAVFDLDTQTQLDQLGKSL
jgi:molybdenum cofactor cytidylyltransferase